MQAHRCPQGKMLDVQSYLLQSKLSPLGNSLSNHQALIKKDDNSDHIGGDGERFWPRHIMEGGTTQGMCMHAHTVANKNQQSQHHVNRSPASTDTGPMCKITTDTCNDNIHRDITTLLSQKS